MSNKSIPMKFFETYGVRHDVEGCAPLFAADSVIDTTVAPGPLDFQGYKMVGYAFLASFSDLSVTVLDQLEEGDKVVSRVVWSGTHTGELNGIPATGRFFRAEAIYIDRIADGKIIERREVNDMMGMMQQLGVIPTPG